MATSCGIRGAQNHSLHLVVLSAVRPTGRSPEKFRNLQQQFRKGGECCEGFSSCSCKTQAKVVLRWVFGLVLFSLPRTLQVALYPSKLAVMQSSTIYFDTL